MAATLSTAQAPIIELKGNLLTLMVLRIYSTDLTQITAHLQDKVSQAPTFFSQAPLILDLNAVPNHELLDLAGLVQTIRQQGLVPVAVRGATEQQQAAAVTLSLGILADNPRAERNARPIEPVEAVPLPADTGPTLPETHLTIGPTKIITQPVRSGQQVVALQGDLIILAAVSPGAEILAHRHIHVYGPLRGRALAGVNGDTEARIFCQHLDAELVSIAGHYQINEDLPELLRGKAVQLFLEQERLMMVPLETASR